MKKLLLMAGIFCASISAFSQSRTVLSQTNNVRADGTAIACTTRNSSNQTIGIEESSYYRSYTINQNIKVGSVLFDVEVITGNSTFTIPVTVKLHRATSAFPGSYSSMTQIASGTINLGDTNSTIKSYEVPLNNPIDLLNGETIVAEVYHPKVLGVVLLMGITKTGTSTAPGYLKSCGATVPADIATLSSGASNKIIIDLPEYDPADSELNFVENFKVFPNPTKDVLNIEMVEGITIDNVTITDMTGKVLKSSLNTNSIDVSDLDFGTYVLNINSTQGKAVTKFVKN